MDQSFNVDRDASERINDIANQNIKTRSQHTVFRRSNFWYNFWYIYNIIDKAFIVILA